MKRLLKKHTGTGIVVLLVAALFFVVSIIPSAVGAPPWSDNGDRRGGKFRQRHQGQILGFWQDQQAVEQLALTQEQVQKLRDADYAAREKRMALKSELDQLRLQMDRAFSSEGTDKKTVRQLAEKASGVQGKLFMQPIEARLDLETILTSEQIQKLAQDNRYRKRGGPGSGRQKNLNRYGAGRFGDGDCPRGFGDGDCPRGYGDGNCPRRR